MSLPEQVIRPVRFTLSWDQSFGAYRVSVPGLLPHDGDRVEVRETRVTEAELYEVARILHVMGCVKDCKADPSGWRENALYILEALGLTYS